MLKSVMHLADEGVEHLLEGRGKPAGGAREATLLGSLRVLVIALQIDVWLLQELRQVPSTGEKHHKNNYETTMLLFIFSIGA